MTHSVVYSIDIPVAQFLNCDRVLHESQRRLPRSQTFLPAHVTLFFKQIAMFLRACPPRAADPASPSLTTCSMPRLCICPRLYIQYHSSHVYGRVLA